MADALHSFSAGLLGALTRQELAALALACLRDENYPASERCLVELLRRETANEALVTALATVENMDRMN